MTNYQFLMRFLKDQNLLENKYIRRKLLFSKRDSFNRMYNILNFINSCCGWDSTANGREFWERKHAEIHICYWNLHSKIDGFNRCEFEDIVSRNLGRHSGYINVTRFDIELNDRINEVLEELNLELRQIHGQKSF